MQEFRFNDRFSRLIRDTCQLFADVFRMKSDFNRRTENHTAFMAYAVTARVSRAQLCFALTVRKKLRRVRQHYQAGYNASRREAYLEPCMRRRFSQRVTTHARYGEVVEAFCSNPMRSAQDMVRFARRVEEIYKHTLFACYIASMRGDIVELHVLVRRMLAETDRVIQRDSVFRNQLIRNALRVPA